MTKSKITPEIDKFISQNKALSGRAIRELIEKKFKIVVTTRAVELHLVKARAEAAEVNSAKIESVRSKILDDADKWANKYLQYTDEEIERLIKLIKDADEGPNPVKLESARDRIAASNALTKMLSTIIDFVKPEVNQDVSVNIKPDLSHVSVSDLRELRAIVLRSQGNKPGAGKEKSA